MLPLGLKINRSLGPMFFSWPPKYNLAKLPRASIIRGELPLTSVADKRYSTYKAT